ncbi:glycerophosphodiester phosphodiesterase [Kitasatospora sp. NPDC054939]
MTASPCTAALTAVAVLAAGCAAAPRARAEPPARAERAAAAAPGCDRPVVIGHRGAPRQAPENTLASFEAALREGADWLETDVRTTRDGVPVLMHDDTVDRTTDGTGAVAELTAGRIAELRADTGPGGPEPVPTLEQLLTRLADRRVRLLMEIKWQRDEDVDRIARLAVRSGADVVLYSFSADHLRRAHAAAPGLPVVLLQSGSIADPPDGLPLAGIALERGLATAERIAAEHALGRAVHVWTLDDADGWRAAADHGADGIVTDTPGPARRWADARCAVAEAARGAR